MLRVYCSWPGCVGDDEGAARRGEEAVGHIDGDALLPLGLEPVDQQRQVDVLAGGAMLAAVALQSRELVLQISLVSNSSRPMSVDLPSSTEPQVRKRRGARDARAWLLHQK